VTDATLMFTSHQHYNTAWNDAVAVVQKVWRQIGNLPMFTTCT